jgi:hypothetical protein
MRGVFLFLGLVTAAVLSIMGPRGMVNGRRPLLLIPDMVQQPRYHPQGASPFFIDGRAMRTPPAGTVAYGGADYDSDAGAPRQDPDFLQDDDAYYRGKRGAAFVDRTPLKVTMPLLRRGRERYEVYCAPCHGATGSGNGLMTQYGVVGVASITDDLHRLMPDGEYFSVITNGKNRMMPYAPQIKVRDRWAIVAYLRALMRSRSGSLGDVPEALRGGLNR